MNSYLIAVILIFTVFFAVLGAVAFIMYRRSLRRAKGIERGLKMVPILIHLPPPSDDTEKGNRDIREVMREKISQAEVLYSLIAGTAQQGFKSSFYGQRHLAFEIVATGGLIHFYVAVPIALVSIVEQAVVTAYPGAHLEETEDHNIFSETGKLPGTMGGEILLKTDAVYPLQTFKSIDRDPIEAMINTLAALKPGEGAGVQLLLRPAGTAWIRHATSVVAKKRRIRGSGGLAFDAGDLAQAALKNPEQRLAESQQQQTQLGVTTMDRQNLEAVEEKTKHPGYEALLRIVVSSAQPSRSQIILRDIANTYSLYDAPGMNGFRFAPTSNPEGIVTAFIFRLFPPEINSMILNTEELATVFHLPDSQFTSTRQVTRQMSKQVDGPPVLPPSGLLFGYNEFRGVKKEIRLSPEDRRRHTYIVGQTGTGKSKILENLAYQDMLDGGGFAFIDPHGDTAETLLGLVPKHRAEDVIYFNPADTENPMGLNLFEFSDPAQKDFLIQEAIGMLYKIYDPDHTGMIGPRFEQWFRNAALTLMSDPNGSTFIEIPKVFNDSNYLKDKFKYLTDPTVIDFWVKEMGQTSDYHKSEMLGWFNSKFGAFLQNEMMRNIIGQVKSSFDLRDIMDNKKILIVNLSKGRVGELNAKLLGMMFVTKFQAAAMSRAAMPEADRQDFCLYVDEFQNFSTDSFASILSEARKYRLNLIVANQFISQLTPEIRDAVFGNVGSIVSFRTGPEDAEFLVKQFAPIFDSRDLVNLPIGNAVMRLLIAGLPSQPFSLAALPPLTSSSPDMARAISTLSSAKFATPRPVVEKDIFARLAPPASAAAPATPSAAGATATVAAPLPVPAPAALVAPVAAAPQPAATPATLAPIPAAAVPEVAAAPALVAAPEPVPAPASEVPTTPIPVLPIAPPTAAEEQAALSLATLTRQAAEMAAQQPAPVPQEVPQPVTPSEPVPARVDSPMQPSAGSVPDEVPAAPLPDSPRDGASLGLSTLPILNPNEAATEAQDEINELLHLETPYEPDAAPLVPSTPMPPAAPPVAPVASAPAQMPAPASAVAPLPMIVMPPLPVAPRSAVQPSPAPVPVTPPIVLPPPSIVSKTDVPPPPEPPRLPPLPHGESLVGVPVPAQPAHRPEPPSPQPVLSVAAPAMPKPPVLSVPIKPTERTDEPQHALVHPVAPAPRPVAVQSATPPVRPSTAPKPAKPVAVDTEDAPKETPAKPAASEPDTAPTAPTTPMPLPPPVLPTPPKPPESIVDAVFDSAAGNKAKNDAATAHEKAMPHKPAPGKLHAAVPTPIAAATPTVAFPVASQVVKPDLSVPDPIVPKPAIIVAPQAVEKSEASPEPASATAVALGAGTEPQDMVTMQLSPAVVSAPTKMTLGSTMPAVEAKPPSPIDTVQPVVVPSKILPAVEAAPDVDGLIQPNAPAPELTPAALPVDTNAKTIDEIRAALKPGEIHVLDDGRVIQGE